MRRFRILIAVLILIAAAIIAERISASRYAAYYEEHILDKSVLTHNPCMPPCWYGIVPGDTMSLEKVDEIVGKVPSVGSTRLRTDKVEWSWSGWPGYTRNGWRGEINSIAVKDGKIRQVQLCPQFSLSVAEILEVYGEPEGTWSSQVGVPEYPYVALRMFYPKQGLMCVAEVLPWLEPVLTPETQVYEISYYEPAESLDVWMQMGSLRSDLLLAPMPAYGRMDEDFIERPTDRLQPDGILPDPSDPLR